MNKVLSHFDATHIMEQEDKENRKLTVEERETIDGCRLLQSMIHDLNSNLSSGILRSFNAYEEELYKKVVPLINGTFEELDEESSTLLQKFFKAHGGAVRHSIAKATRNLLKKGGNGVVPYDIPENQTLQEFALQSLLKQKWGPSGEFLVDKVIIGKNTECMCLHFDCERCTF
jgi:UDP-glucose 6-dehydrogenase